MINSINSVSYANSKSAAQVNFQGKIPGADKMGKVAKDAFEATSDTAKKGFGKIGGYLKTAGKWLNKNIWQPVKSFFTEKLPELFNKLTKKTPKAE